MNRIHGVSRMRERERASRLMDAAAILIEESVPVGSLLRTIPIAVLDKAQKQRLLRLLYCARYGSSLGSTEGHWSPVGGRLPIC